MILSLGSSPPLKFYTVQVEVAQVKTITAFWVAAVYFYHYRYLSLFNNPKQHLNHFYSNTDLRNCTTTLPYKDFVLGFVCFFSPSKRRNTSTKPLLVILQNLEMSFLWPTGFFLPCKWPTMSQALVKFFMYCRKWLKSSILTCWHTQKMPNQASSKQWTIWITVLIKLASMRRLKLQFGPL